MQRSAWSSTTATRCLLGLCLTLPTQDRPIAADEAEAIHNLVATQHRNGQFNGSILVARNGKVVYRNAFGEAAGSREKNTPTTPSNLASVSKAFTAMAVMMLAEQGRLSYDDPISKHLPELATVTGEMTVRHLLTNTSGIPDVGDLGIDRPRLTESEMLDAVIKQHAAFDRPGLKYRYSNTGYMLLAMIVERAAKQPFDVFLRERIFKPVGMSSTYLPDDSSTAGHTKGEGGIYSTVDDLLKWDQALYTDRLVKPATLAEAFTPATVREGVTTYGFGWNITESEADPYVWHTGNTANFRAFIGRRLKERLSVIILTNAGNSRRIEIADAIMNILRGRPYAPPKLAIAAKLVEAIDARGIDVGLKLYDSLLATSPAIYDFAESELNSVGYQLLAQNRSPDAIRIFELNTVRYPASSNAFDSLGEAYHRGGKKDLAIKAYRKAVELDPGNVNARNMLRRIE
jgi:CubicO group peptidase (beta-lactamase class C family)